MKSKIKSIGGPIILIFFGLVFLFSNFGAFPLRSLLLLIVRWMPLILLFIGFMLIVRRYR